MKVAVVHGHRLPGRHAQAPARPWRCGDPYRSRPVRRPAAGAPSPCTIRSSPSISTRPPFAASSAAVAARRSLSFTRSSFNPRMRVVPAACAAMTASTGYSSIMLGARSHGTSTPRSAPMRHDQIANRLAALRPAGSRQRYPRPFRPASRRGRSAARSGRPRRWSVASPAPAMPRPPGRRPRTDRPAPLHRRHAARAGPAGVMTRPLPASSTCTVAPKCRSMFSV